METEIMFKVVLKDNSIKEFGFGKLKETMQFVKDNIDNLKEVWKCGRVICQLDEYYYYFYFRSNGDICCSLEDRDYYNGKFIVKDRFLKDLESYLIWEM